MSIRVFRLFLVAGITASGLLTALPSATGGGAGSKMVLVTITKDGKPFLKPRLSQFNEKDPSGTAWTNALVSVDFQPEEEVEITPDETKEPEQPTEAEQATIKGDIKVKVQVVDGEGDNPAKGKVLGEASVKELRLFRMKNDDDKENKGESWHLDVLQAESMAKDLGLELPEPPTPGDPPAEAQPSGTGDSAVPVALIVIGVAIAVIALVWWRSRRKSRPLDTKQP
jgi:hypothetical protein